MKKFIVFGLLSISAILFSQQKGDVRLGGGIGASFGNNGFFGINVSPSVGYLVSNQFEIGALAGYQHTSDDFVRNNLFSVGTYSNYYFTNNFFARAEYNYFTGNSKLKNTDSDRVNLNESALWLGGGLNYSIGRANVLIGVLYNVLYDENDSIFNSGIQPFTGIGFRL